MLTCRHREWGELKNQGGLEVWLSWKSTCQVPTKPRVSFPAPCKWVDKEWDYLPLHRRLRKKFRVIFSYKAKLRPACSRDPCFTHTTHTYTEREGGRGRGKREEREDWCFPRVGGKGKWEVVTIHIQELFRADKISEFSGYGSTAQGTV